MKSSKTQVLFYYLVEGNHDGVLGLWSSVDQALEVAAYYVQNSTDRKWGDEIEMNFSGKELKQIFKSQMAEMIKPKKDIPESQTAHAFITKLEVNQYHGFKKK